VSEKKPMDTWQSYKEQRGCLMHFARLANTLLKDEEGARDNHVLAHESVASLCWPTLYMQNNLNQT